MPRLLSDVMRPALSARLPIAINPLISSIKHFCARAEKYCAHDASAGVPLNGGSKRHEDLFWIVVVGFDALLTRRDLVAGQHAIAPNTGSHENSQPWKGKN